MSVTISGVVCFQFLLIFTKTARFNFTFIKYFCAHIPKSCCVLCSRKKLITAVNKVSSKVHCLENASVDRKCEDNEKAQMTS